MSFLALPAWMRVMMDTHAADPAVGLTYEQARKIDWQRCVPFLAIHLGCLAAFIPGVGISWFAVLLAAGLYVVRMVGITAFYHRYFSHRSFKTSRAFQFLMAVVGNSSAQRGPLWWAAHHRHHHRVSDEPTDAHSPVQDGFLWSHCGWFLSRLHFRSALERVGDLAKYPELMWIDRFDWVIPVFLAVGCTAAGWLAPAAWGTNAFQGLIWGFCISTVFTAHATFTINSLSHVWGGRSYQTEDHSRNNPLLAVLTMGEGWHNNHHRYQTSAQQGFRWWQVDVSFYILWTLEKIGIVSDLKRVPQSVIDEGRRGQPNALPLIKVQVPAEAHALAGALRVPSASQLPPAF